MSLSRDSRQERKIKFLLRKRLQVQHGLARIDYEEDVVIPVVEALKSGKAVLGLPDGTFLDDAVVQYADQDSESEKPASE